MTSEDAAGGAGEVRIADVEDAIQRIPSVNAVRVVTGPGGRITEVHVLAQRDRSPKQLVRDVQSVALASFGIEVDYRTVSVVQLDGQPAPPASAASAPTSAHAATAQRTRPALVRVASEVSGHATEVTVVVRSDERELVGTARGPASTGLSLVSRAVCDALAPMMDGLAVDPDVARVVGTGDHEVAVCVLRTARASGDLTVVGSAVVRRDQADAIARATLSGLNRLVSGITLASHADDDAAGSADGNTDGT